MLQVQTGWTLFQRLPEQEEDRQIDITFSGIIVKASFVMMARSDMDGDHDVMSLVKHGGRHQD